MSKELKGCPFCGREIHEADVEATGFGEPDWLMITCPRCCTTSGASRTKEQVILRWNTRAAPSELQAENERLAEAVEVLRETLEQIEADEAAAEDARPYSDIEACAAYRDDWQAKDLLLERDKRRASIANLRTLLAKLDQKP